MEQKLKLFTLRNQDTGETVHLLGYAENEPCLVLRPTSVLWLASEVELALGSTTYLRIAREDVRRVDTILQPAAVDTSAAQITSAEHDPGAQNSDAV
jgi:hypothetical protein